MKFLRIISILILIPSYPWIFSAIDKVGDDLLKYFQDTAYPKP